MLEQLIHNGVVVPEPPSPLDLVLTIQGEPVALTPKEEEMAMAWAKKQGTPYVEDPTFVRNFMADFSRELGIKPVLRVDEVDFGPAIRIVEAEREAKAALTKEERKALAAERKAKREALREQYGYATVNGEADRTGQLCGRAQRHLYGPGPAPSARALEGRRAARGYHPQPQPRCPPPPDEWGEIVWQPESLWVARWKDKLSGKLKYVWLSDTAPIKQEREARKFDKAHDLHAQLRTVRAHIERDLADPDAKRRKIATACYLIDAFCLRVGDEKDPDEADTVGATTLRPEHVTLHDDGVGRVPLPGQGLGAVAQKAGTARGGCPEPGGADPECPAIQAQRWQEPSDAGQTPALPRHQQPQRQCLPVGHLCPGCRPRCFVPITPPLPSARVWQTSAVEADDPEHVKWEAANLANLEAAVLCNHTKKAPASWSRSRLRYRERREKAEARARTYRERLTEQRQALADLRKEAREKRQAAPLPARRRSRPATPSASRPPSAGSNARGRC